MRRRDKSRKEPAQFHAAKRAGERYKQSMSTDDIRAMEKQIRRQTAVYLCGGVNEGTEIWLVQFRGTKLKAVYKTAAGRILTFLPKVSASRKSQADSQDLGCIPLDESSRPHLSQSTSAPSDTPTRVDPGNSRTLEE